MVKSNKAILKIAFGLVTFSMLGLTTGLPAAQNAPLSNQEQELSRLVTQFVKKTTKVLRQDEHVEQHDEQQQLAMQALERRPLEPLNRNLFVPQIYPETPPTVPASGPPPTEEQIITLLEDYLAKDWPRDPHIQKVGLEIFNHPLVKEKIPNPSLRAALLGLGRTIAVDAIPFILLENTPEGLPKVVAIGFGIPEEWQDDTGAVARAFGQPNEQMFIIFNPRHQSDNPFLFTKLMAHEPLHNDAAVANIEEVINLLLESFVHLQQLSRHPELGSLGTELARRTNSNAFARFNAGEGHRLGNTTNDDRSLLPGSPLLFTEWLDQLQNLPNFVPTPGNDLLGDYLSRLQEKNTTQCSAAEFNEDLLFCVLENQRGLTPKKLVAAANALQLDTQLTTLDVKDE